MEPGNGSDGGWMRRLDTTDRDHATACGNDDGSACLQQAATVAVQAGRAQGHAQPNSLASVTSLRKLRSGLRRRLRNSAAMADGVSFGLVKLAGIGGPH